MVSGNDLLLGGIRIPGARPVTDAKAPEGEGRIFSEVYRRSYPKSGPKDAQGASSLQFRTMFVNRMGKDLSSWFTAFPSDETKEMD